MDYISKENMGMWRETMIEIITRIGEWVGYYARTYYLLLCGISVGWTPPMPPMPYITCPHISLSLPVLCIHLHITHNIILSRLSKKRIGRDINN